MAARRQARGVSLARLARLALALPGAEEGTSYGTPAWKVRGKLFARLHQNGEDVVVKVGFDERDARVQANPKICHVTDHYANVEMMLVRLAAVSEAELRELLETSWRRSAPKRLLAERDPRS
jgi:hypothetical protein